MRVDAIFKFTTTFDRYVLVAISGAGGTGTANYQVKDTGLQGIALPVSGGSFNLITKFPMNPGDQLQNMADREGTHLFAIDGVETDMYVQTCGPQLDGFGRVIGYTSSLKTVPPRDKITQFETLNKIEKQINEALG